jgi:hypothetical protein
VDTCQISWIDDKGRPTPDDRPAYAYAICFAGPEPKALPICAEHFDRRPAQGWMFLRCAETTPEQLAAKLAEVAVVLKAIEKAFPDHGEIVTTLRYHPSDRLYSFNRWGMFVGIEPDGYIHT